jgi:hypothetical protein
MGALTPAFVRRMISPCSSRRSVTCRTKNAVIKALLDGMIIKYHSKRMMWNLSS